MRVSVPSRPLAATAIALLFATAGCVPQAAPPPVPPPAPVVRPPAPAPAPALGSDWRDWPLTPGSWTWRRDGGGSVARFGTAGGEALLTLRCDLGRRQMILTRAGTAATPLTIRTTSVTRVVPVQSAGAATATLAASDPLLDAMGFSRGRFVVEQAGAATLVVPAWAEIERVTEDCR